LELPEIPEIPKIPVVLLGATVVPAKTNKGHFISATALMFIHREQHQKEK
jgi:hypothetical protein